VAIYVSGKDIFLYQGDSGNITFNGLPTDKNYDVYLSINHLETNKSVTDKILPVQSERQQQVTFSLGADATNELKVPAGESKAIYQYGLKICYGLDEYTLIPEVDIQSVVPNFLKAPKVIVYPKYVEGYVND
jgi:hypothetical protein